MVRCTDVAAVIFCLIPMGVALTSLIGCAEWSHVFGIAFGSLLLTTSSLRIQLLAWERWYVSKNRAQLSGARGVLACVPWWVTFATGYSGRVECSTDNEMYVYTTNTDRFPLGPANASPEVADGSPARNVKESGGVHELVRSEGSARKCMLRLRYVVEFVLFLLVAVQLWARYAGAADAPKNWRSWSEVPACPASSENCFFEETNVTAGHADALRSCTHEWIESLPRTHTDAQVAGFVDGHLDSFFFHIVVLAMIFPFPDDMAIALQDSKLFVHSKSRLGKSDFGVNKKRVHNYLDHLRTCCDCLGE